MRLRIFFLLLLFCFPLTTGAVSPSSISINVAPANPAPNEDVTITLGSYSSNLDGATISWSVNGKTAVSDVGLKSFRAKAPAAGAETRIVAKITLPDGNIEKAVLLRPTVLTLLWQADDSYVPPFYKGKALPIAESSVKIVALPEIKSGSGNANPKNLIYAWRKNYSNDPSASGYGKNYYLLATDYLDDRNNISVTVSTTDSKYSSAANINLNTFEPKMLFYRNDPELGTIWEHALQNGHKIEGEEIIEAAPYFISPGNLRIPSLTWAWSINSTYVSVAGIRKNVLPLKADSGSSGTSKIKLEVGNKYKLLTNLSKEISVEF